jgi:glucose/mannose transport system substrate-binding protein
VRKPKFNVVTFATMLLLLPMLLAGCGGDNTAAVPAATSTAAMASTPAMANTPATSSLTGKLEMFSWWSTGGEAAGLKELYKLYNAQNPNVTIVNSAVAGAAGQDAHAVLNNRLQNNNPPDAFQVHMGHELIDGPVAAGQVENLDSLYQSEGWTKSFPQGVLDIVSSTDASGAKHYWSVPVNIHRANVLWYNKKVFSDAGIANPPTTFDEFFKDADILKAKGIAALALGDKDSFAAPHLMETVLLGTLGADGWKGLWTGATKWDDPKVTAALNNFKKMLGYINSDHASLSWDQANSEVISGKAAMTIMGDWANADYVAKKFTDYGWANSPGTNGIYDALSDTFALPKGAPDRDNAVAWLKLAGSQQGQDVFNPLKGSIPARLDAGKASYNDYLKSAMADWTKDTIVPSVVHGAAASPTWVQAYTDAVNAFVTKQDVTATQAQLVQAAQTALTKK